MPNWCSTDYYVTGPSEDLERFVKVMDSARSGKWKDKLPNDFKDDWLGNVYTELGIFDADELRHQIPSDLSCRGQFMDPPEIREGWDSATPDYVYFSTETAWTPCVGMWKKIFTEFFPTLTYKYLAEEDGCGVYVNTDEMGEYFEHRYKIVVDAPLESRKILEEYFTDDIVTLFVDECSETVFSDIELDNFIKHRFRPSVRNKPNTVRGLKTFIKEFNRKYKNKCHICIYRYLNEEDWENGTDDWKWE